MIAAVLGSVIFVLAAMVLLERQHAAELIRHNIRLWQHITELEGDKRALTESLCRAEGRPFLAPRPANAALIPSEGWWDAMDMVRQKES